MPKDIIPTSMELRLVQIETALDIALRENATAMLEVIQRNAEKLLEAHKGCQHRAYIHIRKRCESMLDRIANKPDFSNAQQ